MTGRSLAAVLVLLATVAVVLAARPEAGGSPSGPHAVYVVGPTGPLHKGTVDVDPARADALSALRALGSSAGFAVVVDDPPGCAFDYVRAVAGHAETSSGGWNYYVRGSGDWDWQSTAASCRGLAAGEAVLWCWVESDERCAAYPA